MRIFELNRVTAVPVSRDEVFDFFSRAENLEELTPPWLSFHIATPTPIKMEVGTLIDYRLKIRGIPMRWRSEISVWDPPHRFVDQQLRGPYRMWHHEHRFTEVEGGTLVEDRVRYAVLGGALIERIFVGPDVRRIFDYREQRLSELFGTMPVEVAMAS